MKIDRALNVLEQGTLLRDRLVYILNELDISKEEKEELRGVREMLKQNIGFKYGDLTLSELERLNELYLPTTEKLLKRPVRE